jgi:hypothetical protein
VTSSELLPVCIERVNDARAIWGAVDGGGGANRN